MRRAALLVGVGLVVVSPVLRPGKPDGFPLSSYPMFAADHGPVVHLPTVVGFDAGGGLRRLDPHTIGGGAGEPVLAAEAVRVALRDGEAAELCAEVAGRVDDEPVERLEVRTEVRDAVADPDAEHPPLRTEVHAECEVPR